MSVTSLTAERIAAVRGSFVGFEGSVDAPRDAPVLAGTVEVLTVDTGDGHLKAPDFFDVDQHPLITFRSIATDATADGAARLEDPWGNERIGLELEAAIDRREFDLEWNQMLPNGNLLVANDVKLLIKVSAVRDQLRKSPGVAGARVPPRAGGRQRARAGLGRGRAHRSRDARAPRRARCRLVAHHHQFVTA